MAFITADRVLDSSTSTGTGAFVVSGTPAAGYRTFSAVMSVNDTCYYSIQGQTTSEWEVGLGTYSSANTLTRTTIYSSSNAGSAVTFSAGTKNVFITMVASRSLQLDAAGNVTPSIGGGTYTRTTITATAGQTSFTANYTVNYVQVYVNGILLNSADYTATTGTTVVLASAAAAGDIIDVFAINIGTFTGGVTITGTPTNGQIATWTGSTSLQGTTILPTANGGTGASLSPTAAGNTIFTADGSVWSSTAKIVRGTAVASTSGTSIDFTSIPPWVKRISVLFNGVSTSGGSNWLVRIGSSSGVETTGYLSAGFIIATTGQNGGNSTVGYLIFADNASYTFSGKLVIDNISSNTWVSSYVIGSGAQLTGLTSYGAGTVTLGGVLDRVRITTVNGTDTFDAGSVNILYE
tara:strand:+ start:1473 stop:2693 length:1221 start_codon:yes stop_codon:yes gene_type:complete